MSDGPGQITVRGICLLIPALTGTGIGLLAARESLALLSLTVLLWVFGEWVRFQWWLLRGADRLHVRRTVNGRSDASVVCFAGRRVRVQVQIRCPGKRVPIWTRVADSVPAELLQIDGCCDNVVTQPAETVLLSWDGRPRAAGTAVLHGVRLRFQDPGGLFAADRFIACACRLRILPTFDSGTRPSTAIKRINSLPQHGIHRLQRAGMGSELLEIREYVPGDPPKSIAWKVSARRGRLMTCEYESDVPIRCIVHVEDSPRMRTGRFGNRLCDTAAPLAAGIVQTALSAGDPAGLVLFGKAGIRRLSPGQGDRMLYRVLEQLALACRLETSPVRWSRRLQQHVLEVCRNCLPDLLDHRVNQTPWTVFPLLPWNRSVFRQRSCLAAVIGEAMGLSVMDRQRLLDDDAFLGQWMTRLLDELGFPFTVPSAGSPEHPFGPPANPGCLDHLVRSIRQSVSRARDNEHHIVICSLLPEHSWEPIRSAVRLARSRHHRVGFVCPLPESRGISANADDPPTADSLLHEAWHVELQDRCRELTEKVRSAGAQIAFAGRGRPLSQILKDLRLAHAGRGLAGGRCG